MHAKDLMTRDPRVVTPGEPLTHAAEIMRDLDVGAVPVVDDRAGMRLRGVITDRDVTVRHVAAAHGPECRVRDHMTPAPVDTVHPDDSAVEVMRRMKGGKVRRIMVADDDGRLRGIIALADVALHEGEELPVFTSQVLASVSEPRWGRH